MKTPGWMDCSLVVEGVEGEPTIRVRAHVRILWWRPAFWRKVRSLVDVQPRWMTWPVIAWVILRHGRRLNQEMKQ